MGSSVVGGVIFYSLGCFSGWFCFFVVCVLAATESFFVWCFGFSWVLILVCSFFDVLWGRDMFVVGVLEFFCLCLSV